MGEGELEKEKERERERFGGDNLGGIGMDIFVVPEVSAVSGFLIRLENGTQTGTRTRTGTSLPKKRSKSDKKCGS